MEREENELHVSCISFYEIEQKRMSGKLKFDYDFKFFVKEGIFKVVDLTLDHINLIKDLPLIHKDPFDRMIIAQSIVEGIPLVTADKHIHQYDFPHVKA